MNDSDPSVGFLHPGAMGAELARWCRASSRLWAAAERSSATAARAGAVGLQDVGTIEALVDRSEVIVSICPPAAATDVAHAVAALGFDGVYVDANAISPDRARAIGEHFERFVDAGVVGPPPTEAGTTRLYVSGNAGDTDLVGHLWSDTNVDVRSVGSEAGASSALKMAYAGWTKGSAALLLSIAALAHAEGVLDDLHDEWHLSQPGLAERAALSARATAPKAWRFVGEMHEIAATLGAAGLPDGFHRAAAETYGHLAARGDARDLQDAILQLLDLD